MKYLLIILLLLPIIAKPNIRDTVPTGAAPQLFGGKLYEFRNYVLIDSFLMVMGGDTFAIPRWPALKYKNSDNRWYGYHGTRWRAFLNGTDTISLSNRIDAASINPSWQQTLNVGNTTSSTLIYDTALVGNPVEKLWHIYEPLVKTDTAAVKWYDWQFSGSNNGSFNEVKIGGWNINAGGGPVVLGKPGLGYSWESNYQTNPLYPLFSDRLVEAHDIYVRPDGMQIRLGSYTINTNTGTCNYYHSVGSFNLRTFSPVGTATPYFSVQSASNNVEQTFINPSDQSEYFHIGSNFEQDASTSSFSLSSPVEKPNRLFRLSNFTFGYLPSTQFSGFGYDGAEIAFNGATTGILSKWVSDSSQTIVSTFTNVAMRFMPNTTQALDLRSTRVNIYQPTGIGTGVSTPIAQLDVRSGTQDQTAYIESTKAGGYAAILNTSNASGANVGLDITAIGAGGGNKGINFNTTTTTSDWNYYAAGNAKFYNKGKVGIGEGVTTPDSTIQINGSLHTNAGVRMENLPVGPGTKAVRIDATGTLSVADITAPVIAGRWLTKTNDTIYWDIINKRVGWYGVRNANAFGDSYTTFDALNFWRKSWIHIVANTLGFTLHNYAVSGTGVYQTSANANRYIDPATNTAASFIYIGLNEARRGAIASKLFTKYEEGIRTTVVQNLLDSVYYANDASVTQGGTWASRSLTSLGGKAGWYGTNGLLSTGTSNTLTKVITGDKIAVGYIGVDGTNMTGSTFTIDITTPSGGTISRTINPNNRTDGISDGINSNASLSCVAYFTGLGDTTHTVTITTQGADSVYIDYIANLRDAQNVPPVIIQQVPYLNQDGYNYTADPGLNYDNNARTDSMNDVLRTVVNQFTEFPVTLVRTNSYIDTTMLLGDDIHYDSVAHFNMSVATLQNISTSYTASATAAGSTGDVQFKGAAGGFDASSNLNFTSNVLKVNGQVAAGAPAFSADWLWSAKKVGGHTIVGMTNDDNNSNTNTFEFIKSKAGNYNLGAGIIMGRHRYGGGAMEYGVVSDVNTDGSGFSLGNFYWNVSGAEVARLNSSGAFLINRNAQLTSEKLRVNGDAYFESNSGNTLISLGGANAAVSTYSAWVKNTGGNTVVSFANYDNNANYPQLYFEKKRGGSYNVNVGDTVGEVSFTNFSGIRGVANTTTDGSFRASDIQFFGADGALAVAERMRMTGVGNFGIGISSPAASLHIKAGTATAGTAPLKLTAGTNLTTPEAGAIEFDGTHYYGTVGSTRYQLDQQLDGNGIYGGSGSLPGDVTVTGGSNGITFTSTRTGTNSTVNINNTSTGRGLTANSTSGVGVHGSSTNSIGILGMSTNSIGVWAESSSADALYAQSPYTGGVATLVANPATTNTVHTVLNLTRASTSPGANSIGGSIDFNLNNTFSAGSVTRANQLISQFTTATSGSETSAFTIKGINNGSPTTIAVFDGDGTFTTAGKRIITVTTSAAGTLTLGNSYSYIFNGTTTTWTLPPVSGTNGTIYKLKNIGSGSITLNADSGNNEIYSTSAVNTYAITAGSAIELISNGTYWTVN